LIARIFRVQVPSALHAEFEHTFLAVSLPYVQKADGLVSVQVGRPTRWEPEHYVMVSIWRDEVALRSFAGEEWSSPVIPSGMERFVEKCWVHHFELFGPTVGLTVT
jgi:quinol monooxygenase YgiN